MVKFYDTNALLNGDYLDEKENFYISNLTITELENIKNNPKKDPDIKYKARQVIKWLSNNENKFTTIIYNYKWDSYFKKNHLLPPDSLDSKIIISAINAPEKVQFITNDYNCKYLAKECGLEVDYSSKKNDEYTGFKIFEATREEQAYFFNCWTQHTPFLDLLPNEYLLLKDKTTKEKLGVYKYTPYDENLSFKEAKAISFTSKMFNKIKPKDEFQLMAMDSLENNQITLLRGPAGSGKSTLALAYLFAQLEKRKIDKIVIFCNTVATLGSAKLGFYPGDKDSKLLDSQIGNMLGSKLGSKDAILNMIDNGTLLLVPMSDIRGFDTSGMNAGIYITEAQNFNIDMMKLALQRIGEDSFCILDGDDKTQLDSHIYAGDNNGIRRVSKVFRGQDIYGEIVLQAIYRSKIAAIADKM